MLLVNCITCVTGLVNQVKMGLFQCISVMACEEPDETPGGTFTCAGGTTDFRGECHLECTSSDGYTGDTDIICNVHTGDGTVGWSSTPTCSRKQPYN